MNTSQEYVEPKYRADAPRPIIGEDGIERMLVGGKVMALVSGGGEAPRLMGALCRADNNWLSDFCKQAPDYFATVALMPLMGIEAAVHAPACAPSWQEIQGLGMPVAFHEGATGNNPFVSVDRRKKHPDVENPGYLSFAMSYLICHLHEQQIALI